MAGGCVNLLPDACAKQLAVSRETLDRLKTYVSLLQHWNPRINLVGRNSLDDVWRRHILDSGQLAALAPPGRPWIDLGSGAGLPGLILAIMRAGPMHLVEADARKCAFLREAARLTGTDVTIHNGRIETVTAELAAQTPALITARALAPLPKLLPLVHAMAGSNTMVLLPKGRDVEVELTETSKSWNMRVQRHPSLSDPDGRILQIEGLSRVECD